jgi:hypothetical protein
MPILWLDELWKGYQQSYLTNCSPGYEYGSLLQGGGKKIRLGQLSTAVFARRAFIMDGWIAGEAVGTSNKETHSEG